MKQLKKRIGLGFMLCSVLMLTQIQNISAKAPKFDDGAARETFKGFMDPFTTFLLFAIPGSTIVILLFFGLKWLLFFDDEEKEKKPFSRFAKRVIIVAVVLFSLDVLLKIVGVG